ncbi:MAG TPA: ComEA family DNA-binding protein [Ktedonobacteraceae bacterium]|nr:ComEA family DNA-binding protein [Ktedonobacteraceae bacterium]
MQQKRQFKSITSSPQSLPIFQQGTQPQPIVASDNTPLTENHQPLIPASPSLKKRLTRIVAVVITLLLAGAIFFIWFAAPTSTSPPPGISQQSFGSTSQSTAISTGGYLHVYVIGAIRHPGIYALPPGARVYQLLQAAGGALPQANLVLLNLAAPLTDGQEVYVLAVGEIPPTYQGGVSAPSSNSTATTGTGTGTGQLININTASVDAMRQALHISSVTAQKIIDYRTQHGSYTSIDQLLQVVSRSIYDKIKNDVTV